MSSVASCIPIGKTERQHRLRLFPIRFSRLHDFVVKLFFLFRIDEFLIVGEFSGIGFLNIADGLIKTLYLRRVRRQDLPENLGLHLSDVLRRVVDQGQFVQGARLLQLIVCARWIAG